MSADLEGMGRAISATNAREANINYFAGGARRFVVDIPVLGTGEVIQQVWFPASYTEKPLHSWGFELVGGHSIPENGTPMATVMIRSWNTEVVEDSGIVLYQGCRVAMRTYSPIMSEQVASYSRFAYTIFFEGRAIIMPGKGH